MTAHEWGDLVCLGSASAAFLVVAVKCFLGWLSGHEAGGLD